MPTRRVAGLKGCRTGGRQERKNSGQEREAGQERFRTGGSQNRRDAGKYVEVQDSWDAGRLFRR